MAGARAERSRDRILDAAERLILEHGLDGVGMETVAEAAGVSRQSVYNKFGSKGGLLLAMNARVEARLGIPTAVSGYRQLADGMAMLTALMDQSRISEPGVAPFVRVVYAARLHDEAAATLWNDRITARHRAMGRIIKQLAKEGRLRPGLSVRSATDILWSIIHPLNYDNLVATRGWTMDEYRRHVEVLVRAALFGEAPAP